MEKVENLSDGYTNDYVAKLLPKLDHIEDKELAYLIRQLINEREYLLKIANIDPLTGLNNRRILGSIRNYSGVLILDIDDFKNINDTFGHNAGDSVLKLVANILKTSSRAEDSVCRIGGDEFVIIFMGCSEDVIKKRGEAICQNVANKGKYLGYNITISVGAAFNEGNQGLEELIDWADKALYESKCDGKNRVKVFPMKAEKKKVILNI